jgi:hypothetical protein
VPVNSFSREGSSTYSVGVITKSYGQGYNSFALPLRMMLNVTQILIDNTAGQDPYGGQFGNVDGSFNIIFYYNTSRQKWIGIPGLLPAEFKHLNIGFGNGYLIHISKVDVKFSFIGN